MNILAQGLLDWFIGDGRYMRLDHCMGWDYPWIAITVALDFAAAAGYCVIARHWWRSQRDLPPTPAKQALGNMRNIFLFCGICGYLFIPIKMVWPAWRLYDMVMVVLVYFTWRYAWRSRELKAIYTELGRTTQLAEDLEKSREESRRKSFFLNAISHDLRTPLNGLLLQANLAEVGLTTDDRETAQAAVADIKQSARATAELLDSFLEYARLDWSGEANTVARFDAADVVRDALAPHQAAAMQKGLYLRSQVSLDLPVETDRHKLHRILGNLISNAVKFTDHGGITVEVERVGASTVRFHVVDTGIGIPADAQGRLFEEFYQVHNHERDRKKGFGLGLTIAKRLAGQLGGDLTVDSASNRGSRFTLTLPLPVIERVVAAAPAKPQAAVAASPAGALAVAK